MTVNIPDWVIYWAGLILTIAALNLWADYLYNNPRMWFFNAVILGIILALYGRLYTWYF